MAGAVIGVIGAGAMGAGVARRLVENGARVLTLLEGRSEASRRRAAEAGMEGTDLAGLREAAAVLSIVPPGEAMGVVLRVCAGWEAEGRRPVFVDCNALDVRTVRVVGAEVERAGGEFVDGGIIGLPPASGAAGPVLYLSGGAAAGRRRCWGLGLRARAMDGGVGAASALKMSYAGITKGVAAIGTMMILGAERAGAGAALRAELAESQPQLLARFAGSLPDMVPKAYRWVAEMREIAQFLADDPAGSAAFEAIAGLCARIAADAGAAREEVGVIERFARGARDQ